LKARSISGRSNGSGSGHADPPVSRIATETGTAPGPTMLKTPWSPCSSASAIASDTSSSWMNWSIGSKPITVGTRRWRRYSPIIECT
jgi:hypothetical protein